MQGASTSRQLAVRRAPRGLAWAEYGIALLVYAVLAVALSWPTVRHFTTAITSDGVDARHNLWVLWHVQQAVLGREPLFYAPLLYYPHGISLLTHAVGPLEGLFALPFWGLGPEAAYNAALLVGFCLTGYCMYLLARGLGFEPGVALFAGTLLMLAEMTLSSYLGHIEKSFLGLLPLTLLALHRTLTPGRSGWWSVVTALFLLLTLLHTGWQFILAAMGTLFFGVLAWLTRDREDRWHLLRRGLLFAATALVLVGPLLAAILAAARNPAMAVAANYESSYYRPDLVEFILPNRYSRLFGLRSSQFMVSLGIDRTIETTVALSWTGIVLCVLGLAGRERAARRWVALLLLCVLLSLGPSLKVLGRTSFTEYRLPIVLPYAFLTQLPGLDFMRTPGRFMMLGYVAFGIAASFGLTWLIRRVPHRQAIVTTLAITLVLLESWPQPWPQERLRPTPSFYRRIAGDGATYGVFDLPLKPFPSSWEIGYSSHYQVYQMTHRKGIAAGYLSRTYTTHPLFPCLFSLPDQSDVLIDGRPVDCYANAKFELARYGYRYVVWHKPWGEDRETWGAVQAQAFLDAAFGGEPPLVDDELVRVYAVAPTTDTARLTPKVEFGAGWGPREGEGRWATSPATLFLTSPRQQTALLQLTPFLIHDPKVENGIGHRGVLEIQAGDSISTSVEIVTDRETTVQLELAPGLQTITLTLQAGNFRPSDYGQPDSRLLSFAIRSVKLQTESRASNSIPAFRLEPRFRAVDSVDQVAPLADVRRPRPVSHSPQACYSTSVTRGMTGK